MFAKYDRSSLYEMNFLTAVKNIHEHNIFKQVKVHNRVGSDVDGIILNRGEKQLQL